ncbi:MAG: ATP-dependent RNA helicase HrpA, partial [Planctomycetota bacterium]|nr:ATP-dependent RNA helicase HrpA [Planctomycetota bacterium]
ELGTSVGGQIGFKVRFGDRTGRDTLVKVMTDGILLAETQGDRFLEQYDTLIIDEAHERSLNIDFLLGYLRNLLPRRPDLKVIVTSATIDPARFARHFATDGVDAPVIQVSGRTYPVEVRWRPLVTDDPDEEDRSVQDAVLHAVDELAALDRRGDEGDVLIFMPGEREIRETTESLRKHHVGGDETTEIVPLYARLSPSDQQRIFQAHRGRRIVIATNVAETSLTVPGIRYVIDPGAARISRYSPRTRVQRLPIEAISQASADQRKGRCGRTAPGVCIRLYSEEDYAQRPAFTDPEIKRTNLASVILQMKALRLGKPESFPFLEAPDARAIHDGYETLRELGAVDDEGQLTEIGRRLARLPIDPRIGRMVLAAHDEHCLKEVCVIAAALSSLDPRERPLEKQAEADAAHEQFRHEDSDFLGFLAIWEFWRGRAKSLSNSQLRKACKQNFLSYLRMREWIDVHRQIRETALEMGLRENDRPAEYTEIHKALLSGLLTSVGHRRDEPEYSGVHGVKFNIFPGSGQFQSRPKWVMAAELVRTTKLYARTVAKIQPQWIEQVGAHLVKRSYSNPRWDSETIRVVADEKVTLFGLEIFPKRTVHYGPIDPPAARDLFIHHALVEGEIVFSAPFFKHNQRLMERLEQLEAKARRRGIIADAQARFAFYNRRLPPDVFSGKTFETWRRRAEHDDPRLLFMSDRDLMAGDASDVTEERFPSEMRVRGGSLALDYNLAPGEAHDGVTLTIPLESIGSVDPSACAWLTPGMLEEKVVALIRSLPKETRRHFAPAPEFAHRVSTALRFQEGDLIEAVRGELGRIAGFEVAREAFDEASLPEHLKMRFRVLDERGEAMAEGRDLDALRRSLSGEVEDRLARLDDDGWTKTGMKGWEMGDVPRVVELSRGGASIAAWPAVVDEGSTVGVRLYPTEEAAQSAHRKGLRRLFAMECGREIAHFVDSMGSFQAMALRYAPIGDAKRLRRAMIDLIAERAFIPEDDAIRTPGAFSARVDEGWNRISAAAQQCGGLVDRILEELHGARLLLEREWPAVCARSVQDVRAQLARLTMEGFLTETPFVWLYQYPRYLRAIRRRLERLTASTAGRDAALMEQALPHWRACVERMESHAGAGVFDPALEQFRWMIEERRVSLFAQELG